jgi:hypothetical protein
MAECRLRLFRSDYGMITIRKQIHNNAVALISLFIAVGSLAYNTWRNETTEEQRNVRHASFRVLENLGELQQVVDMRYYYLPFDGNTKREGDLRIRGFGNAAMIHDLMMLMPAPAPAAGEALDRQWNESFGSLDDIDAAGKHTPQASDAERLLTQVIRDARQAVLDVLKKLE